MKCPQCTSETCGEYRCRFSTITHELFRLNEHAKAAIKRDKEQPKWLRDHLTGGRDIPNGR